MILYLIDTPLQHRIQCMSSEFRQLQMLVLEIFLLQHNSLQWSQVSRVVEFYTTNIFIQLHVVPSAPRNLTVTYDANNSTILKIEWIQPLCDNGNRIHYIVSCACPARYTVVCVYLCRPLKLLKDQ